MNVIQWNILIKLTVHTCLHVFREHSLVYMWMYWLLTGLFSVCCQEIRHRSISPALTHIPVPDVLKCNDWLLSSRFDIEPREHAAVGRGISSITLISLSLHMWLLVSFSVFVFADDVHLTRCVKKESLEANALTVPINHPAKILTCRSMRSIRGEGAHGLWRHCEKKSKTFACVTWINLNSVAIFRVKRWPKWFLMNTIQV